MLYSCSHGHTHTIKPVLHVTAHLQSVNLLPVKQTRIKNPYRITSIKR